VALAHNCPGPSALCVHFQVANLSALPTAAGTSPNTESTAQRGNCAFGFLGVVPEESAFVVAMALARIFPCTGYVEYTDKNWENVKDAISLSTEIADSSSKRSPLATPRSNL